MKLFRSVSIVLALLFVTACANDRLVEPTTLAQEDGGGPQAATELWCQQNPELCNSGNPGPTDPDPQAPGYFLGSAVTPGTCFSATGAGINDADFDGMHDYCEDVLANAFRPLLISSPFDCNMGMEPYYAVKHFPGDPGNPTGGANTAVRIMFALAYYLDCGAYDTGIFCAPAPTSTSTISIDTMQLAIVIPNPCAGHVGDSEFITIEVKYTAATQHWATTSMYTSAHWHTLNDRSRQTPSRSIEWDEKVGGYPKVYVGLGKHANYPSVSTCEGGLIPDNCQGNSVETRVRAGSPYNLGSFQENFINPGSCVKGGELVQYYPWMYRTECFWTSSKFAGWDLYGPGVTPYRTELIISFECRFWNPGGGLPCDWGVNRKTG